MPAYTADTSRVSSVWSSYGHRFTSTDVPEHESCLTCGATFQLLALENDLTRGEYLSAAGEAPMECTGDTSMVHGIAGEVDGDPHPDCNCLFCA